VAVKRRGTARYAELFERAPFGYAVVAGDGTIRELNRTGARLLGGPRARLIGRRLADAGLVDGGDVTLRSGTVVTATTTRLRGDVAVAFQPADRRHDALLATLSHELRGTLAPIATSLFVLSRGEPGGDPAREALDIIARQVAHLRRLADETRDARKPRRREVPDAASGPVARGRRVLVIEDDPSTGDSLVDALALIGHVARLAHDGASGLELARGFRPDIVVCDLGLPGMDGYAVARALRADATLRDSYLIALTGLARPADLRRATRAGFDRHLAKPADLAVLARALAAAPARS
jgi:CheY-like chemotaxis protein